MPRSLLLLFLAIPVLAGAEVETEYGGHTKFRLVGESYPANSVFHDVVGGETIDLAADLRLNLQLESGRWTFDSAWQLVGLQGEGLRISGIPDDDRRLLNLSDVIADGTESALLHRLDRFWVGYTSEKAVVRFGRQALSWGNGLAYAPMDLVNPFDPASIDTEYKVGDDMLYAQYLQDSGNDLQFAWVVRRDPLTGDVEQDQAAPPMRTAGRCRYPADIARRAC
ncbi:MAG: hypothetical protein QNJ11_14785, partial [Woeseiaceae bacterium]|nr:hypothetical protein [Woeseiaceae bacterium]